RTSKHTIYEVLCDDLDIIAAISDTDISSLKLLPSSSDLAGAEIELAQVVIGRERVLEEKLDGVKDKFDYIFIDCPPSLGLLTVNALTATNSVVIPIQCEFFALEGLSQMMNTVKLVKKFLNPLISVDGVVLTMYDSRSKLSKEVNEEIVKFFGDTVFDTKIPRNIRLAEAPSYGKPIVVYDKRCSGAIAYSALADEFLTKIKP
ncbi:MAG: ParA family protein, partial [Clostridia bacterium]